MANAVDAVRWGERIEFNCMIVQTYDLGMYPRK